MSNRFESNPPTPLFRDSYLNQTTVEYLAASLYSTLLNKLSIYDIVVVCIGTDRSTGDALGPLIGTSLQKLEPKGIHVYGTLDHPVHAINLEQTIESITQKHSLPYIIAIDACLGDLKSVGMITLGRGPLKPGAGVQKKLPEIGHLHITGIVNVGGFMEYFVLQNTRLAVVMSMAEKVALAIFQAACKLDQKKDLPQKEALPYHTQDQNSHGWI